MSLVRVSDIAPPRPVNPENAIPRDGRGKPLVIPKTGGKPRALIRTTTFIDCIEDKSGLTNWKMRSVLVGAQRKPSLLEKVAELDPKDRDDKRVLGALAEQAMELSGANEKREKGTELHYWSELIEDGKPLPEGINEVDLADLAEYQMSRLAFRPLMAEQFVICDELGVGGTPDRVDLYTGPGPLAGLHFEDEALITDLKTGSAEYGGLKMAAQLAIYSRGEVYDWTRFPVEPVDNDPDGKKALAAWKKIERTPEEAAAAYSPLPPVNQEWGLIFNLPSGTAKCELLWADLTYGWRMAKLAVEIRAARSQSRTGLRPFVVT